jgi:hypothetical protein
MLTEKKIKKRFHSPIIDEVKELECYIRETEKPIEPETFYAEVYGTKDDYIRETIRSNY